MKLSEALTEEHRYIDSGLEAFQAGLANQTLDQVALQDASLALRRHIYLEEKFLFPPLRQGGLVMAIMVMLKEHGSIWNLLAQLDAGSGDETPDFAALNEIAEQLLKELDAHNKKEEPIIYAHADTDLEPESERELQAFIAEGVLPEGWVCQGAQQE